MIIGRVIVILGCCLYRKYYRVVCLFRNVGIYGIKYNFFVNINLLIIFLIDGRKEF